MVKSFQKYKETDDYRRLKHAAHKLMPNSYEEHQVSLLSVAVPNYYYYNTTSELGIIPPAEHSTVASNLGSGVHKLMGIIGLYSKSEPYSISLKDYLEHGCIRIQIEAAVAGCMFLEEQGFVVMDKDKLVTDNRSGLPLFIDLVIKEKESNQLYALEIKTVWKASNEQLNTANDYARTHREQSLLAASQFPKNRYGAATLHLVVPYEKNVDYIAASIMLFSPDQVEKVKQIVNDETPLDLIDSQFLAEQ